MSAMDGADDSLEAEKLEIPEKTRETMEDILTRHRKEAKQLLEADLEMKKEANRGSKAEQKAKKKAAMEKFASMETEMKARHKTEIAAFASEPTSTADSDVKSSKVVSKSQKKKEKRLQEEAERERRIAEEKKGLVSLRLKETLKLIEKLKPNGLAIKEIKPDGHCLFRAFEDQLSLQGNHKTVSDLRAMAANYMRSHVSEFIDFLAGELSDSSEYGEGSPEERFQKYCDDVESTACWGGHVEIQALSISLERSIVVYSADSPDLRIGSFEGEPLRVSFHKHAFGLGEHYNSVVPLQK